MAASDSLLVIYDSFVCPKELVPGSWRVETPVAIGEKMHDEGIERCVVSSLRCVENI
jgi:hypothetical protein